MRPYHWGMLLLGEGKQEHRHILSVFISLILYSSVMQRTSGWAWRRSTVLHSSVLTSYVLTWRTGRRRSTGLSIVSQWKGLPKITPFMWANSLVTCLTWWSTTPAWDSQLKTGITIPTETQTALAPIQVKTFRVIVSTMRCAVNIAAIFIPSNNCLKDLTRLLVQL